MAIRMSRRCIPYTPNRKPLDQLTIALITTAGVHRKDQEPFDLDGDYNYRLIAPDAQPADLMVTHKFYDHTDADKDVNVIFPLEVLRDLAGEGVIGGLADKNFGTMGASMNLRKFYEELVPALADQVERSKADAALITGGCPHLCHRTAVAIAREIEMRGLPTVHVSVAPEASLEGGPPRILYPSGFAIGNAFGRPGQRELQRKVVLDALQLLTTPMEPGNLVTREYPEYVGVRAA